MPISKLRFMMAAACGLVVIAANTARAEVELVSLPEIDNPNAPFTSAVRVTLGQLDALPLDGARYGVIPILRNDRGPSIGLRDIDADLLKTQAGIKQCLSYLVGNVSAEMIEQLEIALSNAIENKQIFLAPDEQEKLGIFIRQLENDAQNLYVTVKTKLQDLDASLKKALLIQANAQLYQYNLTVPDPNDPRFEVKLHEMASFLFNLPAATFEIPVVWSRQRSELAALQLYRAALPQYQPELLIPSHAVTRLNMITALNEKENVLFLSATYEATLGASGTVRMILTGNGYRSLLAHQGPYSIPVSIEGRVGTGTSPMLFGQDLCVTIIDQQYAVCAEP